MVARTQALPVALNHMTVPRARCGRLFAMAAELGCVGVEFRNDLGHPLFDGKAPSAIAALSKQHGVQVLALAEVKQFNRWSSETESAALALMDMAVECGASAVSLIPLNDGTGCGNGERQANLRLALRNLHPMLEERNLVGLIEPLGFTGCSLRYKEEAVDAIEGIGGVHCFKIIHDTFHHFVSGETNFFPAHTGMVHVSGVVDLEPSADEMLDAHRVLVDASDRLGNIAQLQTLRLQGYRGPASFEAFSPAVHTLSDVESALRTSMEFIDSHLAREAA